MNSRALNNTLLNNTPEWWDVGYIWHHAELYSLSSRYVEYYPITDTLGWYIFGAWKMISFREGCKAKHSRYSGGVVEGWGDTVTPQKRVHKYKRR